MGKLYAAKYSNIYLQNKHTDNLGLIIEELSTSISFNLILLLFTFILNVFAYSSICLFILSVIVLAL